MSLALQGGLAFLTISVSGLVFYVLLCAPSYWLWFLRPERTVNRDYVEDPGELRRSFAWTAASIVANGAMLVPVHLGMHWCLATIDMDTKSIVYYDSMGGNNKAALRGLANYLTEEHRTKKSSELDLSGWKQIIAKKIRQLRAQQARAKAAKPLRSEPKAKPEQPQIKGEQPQPAKKKGGLRSLFKRG